MKLITSKAIYLVVTVLLLAINSNAQEKIFDYDPGIPNQAFGIAASYHTINPADSSMAVFIVESHTVHGIFCDKHFNIKKKVVFEQPEKDYTAIIGHSMEGNTVHLFFAGKKANELYAVSFNPNLDAASGKWVPVIRPENEEDEVYIAAINHRNSLYLLFINKASSNLKLYHIGSPANVTAQTFDPPSGELYDHYFKNKHPLANLSLEKAFSRKLLPLASVIPDDVFINLDVTSSKNKVYSYQNHIILSLDDDISMTTLIEIDPQSNSLVTKHFAHENGTAMGSTGHKSGSFYYRNSLLQVRANDKHLVFTVRDVETDSLQSCNEVFATNPAMTFANMPFVEEVNGWTKHGKLTPQKFLNKLKKLDPALSVFQFDDTLEITIGGYGESKGNSSPMMMAPNGMMTGIGYVPPTKSLLFTIGLFDPQTFKHLDGEVTPHVFIQMAKYNYLRREDISGEIKFRSGNNYYYGFYNCSRQKYFLFQFKG